MDTAGICLQPATECCTMYKKRSRLGYVKEVRVSPWELSLAFTNHIWQEHVQRHGSVWWKPVSGDVRLAVHTCCQWNSPSRYPLLIFYCLKWERKNLVIRHVTLPWLKINHIHAVLIVLLTFCSVWTQTLPSWEEIEKNHDATLEILWDFQFVADCLVKAYIPGIHFWYHYLFNTSLREIYNVRAFNF